MNEMTSAEFLEWSIFDRLHGPIGPDRHDIGFATVASSVLDAAGAKNLRLIDFMPLVKNTMSQSEPSKKSNFSAFKRAVETLRSKTHGNNR